MKKDGPKWSEKILAFATEWYFGDPFVRWFGLTYVVKYPNKAYIATTKNIAEKNLLNANFKQKGINEYNPATHKHFRETGKLS